MKTISLRFFIHSLTAAVLIAFIGATTAHAGDANTSMKPQRVLVHLGQWTNDLHSAHMALRIGTNLLEHHADVTLFLDREGVRLADKRQPVEHHTWADTRLSDDYADFVDAGGAVLVCPGCAADAGIAAKHLRPGAVMGTHDSIAEAILHADKIIDY
jgi:sulfur relay (sulfurtransferase) complex TusBCD TusD component (DsrE family)